MQKNYIFGSALKTTAAIVFGALVSFLPATQILDSMNDNSSMMAIPPASAQIIVPEDGNSSQNTNASSSVQNTTTSSSSSLLLRGFIGSMVTSSNQSAISAANITNDDYNVAGRWRLFVNESLVQGFIANFTVARTDGSEYHRVVIENIGRPTEFAENSTSIMAEIYTDNSSPSEIIPIKLEFRDRILMIEDISIDESTTVEDEELRNILSIIGSQPIFGIVEFQGTG